MFRFESEYRRQECLNKESFDLEEIVLGFIKRRFPVDCNWLSGNCYYFAQILMARFPEAKLYYMPVVGHFIVKIGTTYYDWAGIVTIGNDVIVEWDCMYEYDENVKRHVIRDCIE